MRMWKGALRCSFVLFYAHFNPWRLSSSQRRKCVNAFSQRTLSREGTLRKCNCQVLSWFKLWDVDSTRDTPLPAKLLLSSWTDGCLCAVTVKNNSLIWTPLKVVWMSIFHSANEECTQSQLLQLSWQAVTWEHTLYGGQIWTNLRG